MNTPGSSGADRIRKAFFHSLSGIRLAFSDEAAFRQEVYLAIALSALCLVLPLESWIRAVLLVSHVVVLIVELLNTAIESAVDRASPEYHHQARKAKDTASAAVLLALAASGGLWCYALLSLAR